MTSSPGLFLGLGNPGPSYSGTRHNFGFAAADALLDLCRRDGSVTALSGGKKLYEAWKCSLPSGGTWIVAKPLTFMNKSGEAAVPLLHFYRIPLDRLVVAHDELDLPLGTMRFKIGGGAAGHNGIRSLVQCAGSPDFYRLRLGIGKPAGYDTTSYVLGRFSAAEEPLVAKVADSAARALPVFDRDGFAEARRIINSFTIDAQ